MKSVHHSRTSKHVSQIIQNWRQMQLLYQNLQKDICFYTTTAFLGARSGMLTLIHIIYETTIVHTA